jgi:hypothetical protein
VLPTTSNNEAISGCDKIEGFFQFLVVIEEATVLANKIFLLSFLRTKQLLEGPAPRGKFQFSSPQHERCLPAA